MKKDEHKNQCSLPLKVFYTLNFLYAKKAQARSDESWGIQKELNSRIPAHCMSFMKAQCSIDFSCIYLYIYSFIDHIFITLNLYVQIFVG